MTRTTDEGGGLEAKKIEKCQTDKLHYVDSEYVEQKLFGHMNSIPFAS